jgi:integrase/recombinase XerD
MARRTKTSLKTAAPAPAVLDALETGINQYLEWIAVHNFSEDTVRSRRFHLGYFHDWCRERGLESPNEITRHILERYQRWLFHYRKHNGQPLGFRTQNSRLTALKVFFQWLTRHNYLLHNPASELVAPRIGQRLPKYVLKADEAEQIIQQPDLSQAGGLRDRAILETFYSTGMRRMELVQLKVQDPDADRGTVTIRQGKGKRDRIIPIGERALAWIAKYVAEARPQLLIGAGDGTLFVNDLGEQFERNQLTNMVRRYLQASGIGKTGGCHLFRHTVATLMLENGADIRVIQQMLGHVDLASTEIYTHVAINLLKQVYSATHPGAHLKRAEAAADLLAELDTEAEEEDDE